MGFPAGGDILCPAQAGEDGKNFLEPPTKLAEGMEIEIEAAEYVEGYKLNLRFSDGTERIVDLEDFLSKSSNPMIKKYLDKEEFKGFTIEYGDLFWNDYDLCFPVADLYEGSI